MGDPNPLFGEENQSLTLFQRALAETWSLLPREIQILHSVQDVAHFSGVASVTRGTSLLSRSVAWVFAFPPAGKNIPVTVTKTRTVSGETWVRNFDGRVFYSELSSASAPYRFCERFGAFKFELDIPVDNGCIDFTVHRGWFLGVALPRFLLPKSDSREFVQDGVFHFDVALAAPLGVGLIVRYQGALRPDA